MTALATIPLEVLASTNYLTGAPVTRACGLCQACCVRLAVVKLGKPYDCACREMRSGACSIYENRPPECAAYSCLWLLGAGREEMRPDRGGVLWDLHPDGGGKFFVDLHELRPGAVAALGEENFHATHEAVMGMLPPDIKQALGGVRVWPHGVEVGNSQPAGNGYPACAVAHTVFMETLPRSGVFVYLGPCDPEGRLVVGGAPVTDEGEVRRVFEECIARLEGR